MNLLKKFMRNDNADLEEENYDDLYVALDMDSPEAEAENGLSGLNAPVHKEPEIQSTPSDKVSLKLLQPKSHAEAPAIADRLKEGCIVLLDISNLKKEHAIRLVDFLAGVAYVLGGEMIKTNKHTIVVSPAGVDISNFASESDAEESYEESAEVEEYEEEYVDAASEN